MNRIPLFLIGAISAFFLFPSSVDAVTRLPVPFTSQAPQGIWSEPWQNACEESTIAMVHAFYTQTTLTSTTAQDLILHTLALKERLYGKSLDENAATITGVINNFFPWEARVVEHPTLDDIKQEIDAGRPVIIPASGKALQNPRFHDGGPIYHTLVIAGYDDTRKEFITEEPGTKYGLDFRYPYDRILDAIHDYVPHGKTRSEGKKVVVFTSPTITETTLDGDRDGLTKAEELQYDTRLWLQDSDGDGYTDGTEVDAGYSPTVAESTLLPGTLIKSAHNPTVYLLGRGIKQRIPSEEVFLAYDWQWNDIKIVSERFLSRIATGPDVE